MPVELPSWRGPSDEAGRLLGVIDAWTSDEAFARLVTSFGGPPETGESDPRARLEALDAFAAEHWDFRRGRERNDLDATGLTEHQRRAVASAALRLGLGGVHIPSDGHYDTVIMTGGMVRAGIVKPRFVAGLLSRGLSVGRVVFLGAFRSFSGDEIPLARSLGVVGADEVQGMEHGMALAFGPRRDADQRAGGVRGHRDAWSSTRWHAGGVDLEVLAAPSSDPATRRANTVDTYRFWLEREAPPAGHRVLIVTTPVYVPYQGASAVQSLGLEGGVAVETVGADAASQDLGPFTQPFTAAHHLQELRAAVHAMVELRAAAVRRIP